MYTSFYIAENRLKELNSFIRDFTPTVRFKHNPLKEGDKLFIALTMEVEDGNKLSELRNKWHYEDNPPKIPNKSIWKQILSVFN
jgi:hypothetical protein